MEDGVHPIDFHVEPNPGNPTCKSDFALRFVQRNICILREAFCVVLRNDGRSAEVIRPLGLDGLCSCDGEKIATTNPTRLGIRTNTHAWGSTHSCRYIHFKRRRVVSKVTQTCLIISIALECWVFHHKNWYHLTSTFC